LTSRLRLGVNIDHVATIRNARGGTHPDPVRAAIVAANARADGITAHLREDRRHITDDDIERLMAEIDLPLNLEMAATEEMLGIALAHRPHAACLVPEKREERTTEVLLVEDVVTTGLSSASSTSVPGASANPRRRWKVPSGRSTNIAGTPSARPISWPMITPPIAGETTAAMRPRRSAGSLATSVRASRSEIGRA
jgi:hypothetical protein